MGGCGRPQVRPTVAIEKPEGNARYGSERDPGQSEGRAPKNAVNRATIIVRMRLDLIAHLSAQGTRIAWEK